MFQRFWAWLFGQPCHLVGPLTFRLAGGAVSEQPEFLLGDDMNLKCTEQRLLSAKVTDARGNMVTLPIPLEWASSDSAIATVTPAADGMAGLVKAVGPVGSASVTAKLNDALMGAVQVNVEAGEPARIELVEGPAEPQAAA